MTSKPDESGLFASEQVGRLAGGVLLLSAIFTVIAMAHHPTGHGGSGSQSVMSLGGFIHATMIVLLAANLWGLAVFAIRQGFGGGMLAGIIAYAISFAGHLAAATINGFIVPAVAASVDHAASGDLFAMLWQSNQAFAQLGVYAGSLAFLIWSLWLIKSKTRGNIVVGGLGLLVALVPAALLFGGAITLNVDGALIVYGAHAVWIGAVGIQLLRRVL